MAQPTFPPVSAANSPPLLLIHGAWHDSRCWQPLLPCLQSHFSEIRTPDLPGHGPAAAPTGRLQFRHYVEAVVGELEAASAPVVLLGHSMAGLVITAAACQVPDKIQALVYLCAYLPRPGESLFDLMALYRQHAGPAPIESALRMSKDKRLCTVAPDQAPGLFYSDLPAAEANALASRLQPQASLPLASPVRFEQAVLESLPTVYITCSRDRVLPIAQQQQLLARQPCARVLELPADHSPFHSCPAALAELLGTLR